MKRGNGLSRVFNYLNASTLVKGWSTVCPSASYSIPNRNLLCKSRDNVTPFLRVSRLEKIKTRLCPCRLTIIPSSFLLSRVLTNDPCTVFATIVLVAQLLRSMRISAKRMTSRCRENLLHAFHAHTRTLTGVTSLSITLNLVILQIDSHSFP